MTDKMHALSVGQILIGSLFNEPMRVETVQSNGAASWIVGLVGTNSERFRKVTMTAEDLERITILDPRHAKSRLVGEITGTLFASRCGLRPRRG